MLSYDHKKETMSSGIESAQSFNDSTFSVQWTPLSPLSTKTWTADATFLGSNVHGKVTIFFPSMTFFGHSMITEIENLINRFSK